MHQQFAVKESFRAGRRVERLHSFIPDLFQTIISKLRFAQTPGNSLGFLKKKIKLKYPTGKLS